MFKRMHGTTKIFIFTMVTGWASIGAQMLQAQGSINCAPRDVLVERLAEKYGEYRQSVGLGANNAMVETFASLKTGTWSIVVTTANGISCFVATGQAFEFDKSEPPKGEAL